MLLDEARRVIEGRSDVAVPEIMQLGASAGGARAKAVVLWNPKTDEVRSAFATPQAGDQSWIIKFDGVGEPGHPDPKPQPFNRTEYAYHLMAREAGIETAESRLLEERRLAHFMSRRFDRDGSGGRIHFHSLAGLDHADYNAPRSYSYEQYLLVCRELRLPPAALEEAFRRAAFNVVSVNQDDHVKNFAFLMNQDGAWRLSPAYDLTYAHGRGYTRTHQLTLNGKAEGLTRADLLKLGAELGLKQDGAPVIDEVCSAVKRWAAFAKKAKVPKDRIEAIGAEHRLKAMSA
jgi:serine/threonine-protein kinase HipA